MVMDGLRQQSFHKRGATTLAAAACLCIGEQKPPSPKALYQQSWTGFADGPCLASLGTQALNVELGLNNRRNSLGKLIQTLSR